jgi:hypothetical protein
MFSYVIVSTCFILHYNSCRSHMGAAIALGYGLDDWVLLSRQGLGIFFLTTASRPALEHTQPPNQWESEALSVGVKRSGRETDHSPPSSSEIKNAWSYNSTPQIRLHGVVLS